MKNDPYVYKKPDVDKISGWLLFFLVAACIGIAGTIGLGLINFNMDDYNWTGSQFSTFFLASIDLLYLMGIAAFGVFMVYSFAKYNPNAPVYGIVYCSLLLYSNLFLVFMMVINSDTDGLTGSELTHGRSIVWSIIWILYLVLSEQVETLFPKEKRSLPNAVLLVAAALVLCPVIIVFTSMYIGAGME